MPLKVDLEKQKSLVSAVDASGNVFKGFTLWTDAAPVVKTNPDLVYAKVIVIGGNDVIYRCKQVEPNDPNEEEFDIKQGNAFNCNTNIDPMTYGDIGMITHKNPACVLDFLRHRYSNQQIYTTAEPLLVAINPYKDLGNTSDVLIKKYRDVTEVSSLPPHVFMIARVALENLHQVNKSQAIIVSGESGAGKTEATKQIMRYFAAAKGGSIDTRIQTGVMAANPVLEAFGNAATIRNSNSSRFGRFMQLQVAALGGIEFGSVRNFLLEKSRVVAQSPRERSYHIFYQMLKGADSAQRERWKLMDIKSYRFINPNCLDADGIDDLAEWNDIQRSFDSMQCTPTQVESIFSVVAGILALGNSTISGGEKAQLDENTMDFFSDSCELMKLKTADLEEGLTVKNTKAGGELVRGYWNEKEAEVLKLSLAKAIYDKLFDWIVNNLNKSIEPSQGFKYFMGMLDIFGFEIFPDNSLEQLFINITNEVLQKNFIDIVFERETRLYREEGISPANLEWTTNADVIEALSGKKSSVMVVLEDQCLSPSATDEKFVLALYKTFKESEKIKPAKISPNQNFIVMHTIGSIQYCCQNFLAKNSDNLRAELVEVIQTSTDLVVNSLFKDVLVERGKLAKGFLISNQYMKQLNGLMELINTTEPHFIRCVKPNEEKIPLHINNRKVLFQLKSLSILEALELRNLGYSYRRPFSEFLFQFRFIDLGIAQHKTMDPKIAAQKLLERAGISKKEWQIGKTMVFMMSQGVKVLTRKQREQLAAWEPLVTLIEAIVTRKFKQEEAAHHIPGLIRFQAHARKFLRIAVGG